MMFYVYYLSQGPNAIAGGFNVFQYVSFRAVCAAIRVHRLLAPVVGIEARHERFEVVPVHGDEQTLDDLGWPRFTVCAHAPCLLAPLTGRTPR